MFHSRLGKRLGTDADGSGERFLGSCPLTGPPCNIERQRPRHDDMQPCDPASNTPKQAPAVLTTVNADGYDTCAE